MIIDKKENILYVGGFNFIKNTTSTMMVILHLKVLVKLKYELLNLNLSKKLYLQ